MFFCIFLTKFIYFLFCYYIFLFLSDKSFEYYKVRRYCNILIPLLPKHAFLIMFVFMLLLNFFIKQIETYDLYLEYLLSFILVILGVSQIPNLCNTIRRELLIQLSPYCCLLFFLIYFLIYLAIYKNISTFYSSISFWNYVRAIHSLYNNNESVIVFISKFLYLLTHSYII